MEDRIREFLASPKLLEGSKEIKFGGLNFQGVEYLEEEFECSLVEVGEIFSNLWIASPRASRAVLRGRESSAAGSPRPTPSAVCYRFPACIFAGPVQCL